MNTADMMAESPHITRITTDAVLNTITPGK